MWEVPPGERHQLPDELLSYALRRHLPLGTSVQTFAAALDGPLTEAGRDLNDSVAAARCPIEVDLLLPRNVCCHKSLLPSEGLQMPALIPISAAISAEELDRASRHGCECWHIFGRLQEPCCVPHVSKPSSMIDSLVLNVWRQPSTSPDICPFVLAECHCVRYDVTQRLLLRPSGPDDTLFTEIDFSFL